MNDLDIKYQKLKDEIAGYDSLLIAFSGGLDSALLVKVCHDVLGDRMLAVTADSPSVPRRELEEAKKFCREIGARLRIIRTHETEDENYARNPADRCYFCKSELYSRLDEIADQENIRFIANGTNVDDLGDYRPGLKAADERRIKSPLRDAGLTKNDIRELARRLGLEIWDKPASPCLASRIPYGSEVTPEKLAQVERAEEFLRGLGIRELRVRHFGHKARIETHRIDFDVINQNLIAIRDRFRKIGFKEIEWQEFKSGALNVLINAQR